MELIELLAQYLLAVSVIGACLFLYVKGFGNDPEPAAEASTVEDRMRQHAKVRDLLAHGLPGCNTIQIDPVSMAAEPQTIYLPNTPPCRRMALASFEQGARITLKGGDFEVPAMYQGINTVATMHAQLGRALDPALIDTAQEPPHR